MIGAYKQSKFLAEQAVKRLVVAGNSCVIVKPTAPFGPRDVKPTPTGRMVVEAASGRMPAYVNTGLNVVHVDDVATVIYWLTKKESLVKVIFWAARTGRSNGFSKLSPELAGRRPPRIQLPHWFVTPLAHIWEGVTRLRGHGEPCSP